VAAGIEAAGIEAVLGFLQSQRGLPGLVDSFVEDGAGRLVRLPGQPRQRAGTPAIGHST